MVPDDDKSPIFRQFHSKYPTPNESPLRPNVDGSPGGLVLIEQPSPEQVLKSAGTLWHYTDGAGLLGMVDGGRIWATHYSMLNDSEELENGRMMLRQVREELAEDRLYSKVGEKILLEVLDNVIEAEVMPDLFVACASEAEDSLSQWRAYGGGQPYAIGLEASPGYIAEGDRPGWGVDMKSHYRPTCVWRRVLYADAEKNNLLRRSVGYIMYAASRVYADATPGSSRWRWIIKMMETNLVYTLLHFKDASFTDEREVRLVWHAGSMDPIRARVTPFGVAPYVAIGEPLKSESLESIELKPSLTVGCIQVGPTPHRDAAANGLGIYLNSNNHQDRVGIEIRHSSSPYRF